MNSYYLEDFKLDQLFKSTGRTVTEADLTLFSMLSGDWNPIHSNTEYSKSTPYGERLVHGVFGMAICTGMLHEFGIFNRSVIAMLGFKDWRFKAPIFIGDTLRLELRITEVKYDEDRNRGKVGREFKLINQDDIVVQEGLSDVLVLVRSSNDE